MATVAIYSLKGGVGKTTLAVNLAWCAASLSCRRTLLWDLDPQAASSWLLGRPAARDQAQAIFSRDVPVAKQAAATSIARLDLVAADHSLRALDRLFRELDKKKRLARLVADLPGYDRIILDCPPGVTETSDQVMRAADLVVVPVVPSPLSIRAFDEVERHFGGRAQLLPVHMMADRRRRLHLDTIAVRPDWPIVAMTSTVEAMGTHRAPVGAYAPRSAAQASFAALWQAVERRLAAA